MSRREAASGAVQPTHKPVRTTEDWVAEWGVMWGSRVSGHWRALVSGALSLWQGRGGGTCGDHSVQVWLWSGTGTGAQNLSQTRRGQGKQGPAVGWTTAERGWGCGQRSLTPCQQTCGPAYCRPGKLAGLSVGWSQFRLVVWNAVV